MSLCKCPDRSAETLEQTKAHFLFAYIKLLASFGYSCYHLFFVRSPSFFPCPLLIFPTRQQGHHREQPRRCRAGQHEGPRAQPRQSGWPRSITQPCRFHRRWPCCSRRHLCELMGMKGGGGGGGGGGGRKKEREKKKKEGKEKKRGE